ncbi:NeuD/PglB/VioB family sugar acetyltransferase [Flagellimonas beolgyonensis]|uniref:NeuD/PglB/VioB family sugar acetyltransferase n=1 Tax=Flagellimonas beolgyonensis TaxID=864064 RepID=UPI003D653CE5|tara:strand:- start:441 stop:1079 length:639 start_codon:yes stop_codon:yes gene_type:complete
MKELILLGGGGHCESVIEVIHSMGEFTIKGILDPSYDQNVPSKVLGYPIIGNDEKIEKLISEGYQFVITVGQIHYSKLREKLFHKVVSNGGKLPIIKAKTSYVSREANISEGTVIHHNVFINANVNLGKCCIVNSGSIIEHSCSIGDFCHVSTGTILNGEVSCGKGVFIGSGTVVNQCIEIGDNLVIASGSLVRSHVMGNGVYAGNPLRKIK